MKRFVSVTAFCFSLLLVLGLWLFPAARAKQDPIITLLNLPAPPAPNPWVRIPAGIRLPEFYDKESPPPDDAPVEDLMEYWSRMSSVYAELGYNPRPSDRVMGRLFQEIEREPKRITDFINLMQEEPRGINIARDRYERLAASTAEDEREQRRMLKRWLVMNSDAFAGDLEKVASTVQDVREYVNNHEELLALSKVDWERASPIVNRLYNDGSQKVSKTLATWALYRNALRTGGSDVDRYRDELKAVVEDKTAGAGARDLALDALVKEKDWSGRDEWFFTLLEDETLHDLKVNGQTYTGLTTIMYYTADEALVPRLIDLTGSDNIALRSVAVKNLLLRLGRLNEFERNKKLRADIVTALLPWFRDPKWVKEDQSGKQTLIRHLASVKLPEAVPALIAALDERSSGNPIYASNAISNSIATSNSSSSEWANQAISNAMVQAANAANSAANAVAAARRQADHFPYRDGAIRALATQADARAVPALRRVLTKVYDYERSAVVTALIACNGFTAEEKVAAIEFMARNAADAANGEQLEPGGYDYSTAKGRARAAMRSAIASQTTSTAEVTAPEPDEAEEEFNSYGRASEGPENLPAADLAASSYSEPPASPMSDDDLNYMLGTALVQADDPGEDVVRGVVARIDAYDKREPVTAEALRKILITWNGRAVNAMVLRDIKVGRIDADAVVKLLAIRKQLRETQPNDVTDTANGVPAARGIAACLLEDAAVMDAALDSGDDVAKTAMLTCARLIRAPLSVQKVAANLKSQNKTLAIAAERYLEAEDSAESRGILLALYPNQAKVLGARTGFEPGGAVTTPGSLLLNVFATVNPYYANSAHYSAYIYDGNFTDTEKRLRKEVTANPELIGVYAYDDNFVHIYKDRAVFSWSDDPARYRERVLEEAEWENLKSYLAHYSVDHLPPFLACSGECDYYELLMLSRMGGRRVFFKTSDPLPEFVVGLDKIFDQMRERPAKLKYYAAAEIPGLEVHFADTDLSAKSVWKDGPDIRILVSDEKRSKELEREITTMRESEEDSLTPESNNYDHYQKFYKMREDRKFDSFGWFRLQGEKLGDTAPQPLQAEYIPLKDGLLPPAAFGQWRAKTTSFEIRADDKGLHRIAGGRVTLIKAGNYSDAVVTANGRWAVATKYDNEMGPTLVRVNLSTKREYVVPAETYVASKPLAYVPVANVVLVTSQSDGDHEEGYDAGGAAYDDGRGYHFFNPDTGALTAAVGEVRPVAQQTFRGLQPTGVAGEYWAALPRGTAGTIVGIYESRTFRFRPLLKLPKIVFDSTEMWVDATARRVWFTYQGHVLSAPIK